MRLTIDIEPGSSPVAGRLTGPGTDVPFTTWVGLLGALQDACAERPAEALIPDSEAPCPD